MDAGFATNSVFVIGKPYSTVPEVAQAVGALGCYIHHPPEHLFRAGYYAEGFRAFVNEFWQSVAKQLPAKIKRIVVLDEGGWLLRVVPNEVVAGRFICAAEHTMYGIQTTQPGKLEHPIVMMAASAAKTMFESLVIADAIVDRLLECVPSLMELQIGVIGLGNVGMAVAKALSSRAQKLILGYDMENYQGEGADFICRVSHATVVAQSDIIIGCTGQDVLPELKNLREIRSRRWLASCSSGDFEFSQIARQLAGRVHSLQSDPFQEAQGKIGSCHIALLNGGFPINFDRKRELENPARIQLTRELTFASVMQAALFLDESSGNNAIMLDPEVQRGLVERWLNGSHASSLFPSWRSQPLDWWATHSAGQEQRKRLADFIEVA